MKDSESSDIKYWWFEVDNMDGNKSSWDFLTMEDLMRFIPDYIKDQVAECFDLDDEVDAKNAKEILEAVADDDLGKATELMSSTMYVGLKWDGPSYLQTYGRTGITVMKEALDAANPD
jgi:hypothetical protein